MNKSVSLGQDGDKARSVTHKRFLPLGQSKARSGAARKVFHGIPCILETCWMNAVVNKDWLDDQSTGERCSVERNLFR